MVVNTIEHVDEIKHYVQDPPPEHEHLRSLIFRATENELGRRRKQLQFEDPVFDSLLEMNSQKFALYINMLWDGTESHVWAFEIGQRIGEIERSRRGMYDSDLRGHALDYFWDTLSYRLVAIDKMEIDRQVTEKLVHEFFSREGKEINSNYEYVTRLAEELYHVHASHHSPESGHAEDYKKRNRPVGDEADPGVRYHTARTVTSAIISYIEHENVIRGNPTDPLDPVILLNDIIVIQDNMINAGRFDSRMEEGCYEMAIKQLAKDIDALFGTDRGAEYARHLRHHYRMISDSHQQRTEDIQMTCDQS